MLAYTEIVQYQVVMGMNLHERKFPQNRIVERRFTFLHANAETEEARVATDAVARKMRRQLKVERFIESARRSNRDVPCKWKWKHLLAFDLIPLSPVDYSPMKPGNADSSLINSISASWRIKCSSRSSSTTTYSSFW